MGYLLDTHTAIWALENSPNLSKNAKDVMAQSANVLYISIVSAWEIAIKVSIGKLSFHGGSRNFLHEMDNNGVKLLGIKVDYLEQAENLPFIHRDPFDRLLVATAITDGLVILSADENIHKYDAETLW